MLDYYGSINMSRDDIKNDIVLTPKYKNYNKEYLYEIINYLYTRNFLLKSYSCSGWNIFNKKDAMKYIDDYIKENTLNCKRKLAIMLQLVNSEDIVYEPNIFKCICDNLKTDL